MAEIELKPSISPEIRSASNDKAIVVGLYGVSGCGKTHLLKQLKQKFGETQFAFYEGSKVLDSVVPGHLKAFDGMKLPDKEHWRKRAIDYIGKQCTDRKKVGVVAGHFMFWPEEQQAGTPACTENDLKVFTHILYLDIRADVIAERSRNDPKRNRPTTSARHLHNWQHEEKIQLSNLCRQHGILFSLISPRLNETTLLDRVSAMLLDFKSHNEDYNLSQAKSRLDEFVAGQGQLEKVLVMDADRTLAPQDTGVLFWEKVTKMRPFRYDASTLKTLFSGPLGYTYTAFRQAVLLYEEAVDGQEFDELCQEVALAVTMHPDFVSLLQLVAEEECVGAVVVTSGLRRVWLKVLEREGLSEKVGVIGGGRIEDRLVVTEAVKGALVVHLQEVYEKYVCAFGDSPLDLTMLHMANIAFIVVGEEHTRSATMDHALTDAIDSGGLGAKQVLLPATASPRLDTTKLPLIKLTEPKFVEILLLGGQNPNGGLQVLCATDKNAAKLLATPMRDAAVAGPNLREAHRRVGHYLAIEYLADVIGLEPCPIRHVQGHKVSGFQLFHEQQTTIVALMRGGEPMALGVNDAFPRAMFVHASEPEDLKPHHLDGQITVILVDSVVNTGKTIVDFVQRVRELHATIRIVVVVGVVQAQCVKKDGLKRALAPYGKIHLVALRVSDTKFKGSRATDTGNRLFNTIHLD